jgi:hypothetical protein
VNGTATMKTRTGSALRPPRFWVSWKTAGLFRR